jgi:hypothetical protein
MLYDLSRASLKETGKSYKFGEAMLTPHSTLRKYVACILPLCLLCLRFGCVAICSHHLEEAQKACAHGVTALHADEDCPITPAVANALSERSFLSAAVDGAPPLIAQVQTVETAQDISANQPESFLSPSPPSERLRILRI